MNKTISVIVPVYNSKKYLKKCLMSILDQTYKHIQLICIDDGSTDGSKDIICDLMKIYDNIEYVYEDNSGVSCARNRGLSLAKGEYVTFIDSDDFLTNNDCFAKCIAAIRDRDALIFDVAVKKKTIIWQETFIDFILQNDLWGTCGKIVKKECLKKLFNEHSYIGEDLKFWFDNKERIRSFIYIDDHFYNYTQNSDSAMNSKKLKSEITEYFDNLYDIVIGIDNKKVREKMAIFYVYSYYSFYQKDSNGYIKTKKDLNRIRNIKKIVFMHHGSDSSQKAKAVIKASILSLQLRLRTINRH